MRIAYLINQYPSISHSFIRREIQALERQGAAVERFSLRASAHGAIAEEDRAEAAKTRTIVGANPFGLAASALASLVTRPFGSLAALFDAAALGARSDAGLLRHLFYWGEALILAAWLRGARLVHVHAHFGTNSATVAMLAARVNGGGFSMTVHGPEEFDKAPLIGLAAKIKRARFVAAVSSFGMSQLRRLVECDHWEAIRIIPCGVDRAFHAAGADPAPEDGRFVCVGRLSEQKGQLTLVEAAADVKRRGGRFRIVLVGDGELRDEIEAAVGRFDLADEIELAGWRTPAEVRREIARARVFILPSYAEGLPVSIMEAMSLGKPVISTYVAGIPELVLPGENGWLAPAGDFRALADAMLAALSASPARIDEMGRAGRARALSRHDSDAAAARLKSLFAEILGEESR
jgi:glycosyltransferase involved in cell wall biosynthesis